MDASQNNWDMKHICIRLLSGVEDGIAVLNNVNSKLRVSAFSRVDSTTVFASHNERFTAPAQLNRKLESFTIYRTDGSTKECSLGEICQLVHSVFCEAFGLFERRQINPGDQYYEGLIRRLQELLEKANEARELASTKPGREELRQNIHSLCEALNSKQAVLNTFAFGCQSPLKRGSDMEMSSVQQHVLGIKMPADKKVKTQESSPINSERIVAEVNSLVEQMRKLLAGASTSLGGESSQSASHEMDFMAISTRLDDYSDKHSDKLRGSFNTRVIIAFNEIRNLLKEDVLSEFEQKSVLLKLNELFLLLHQLMEYTVARGEFVEMSLTLEYLCKRMSSSIMQSNALRSVIEIPNAIPGTREVLEINEMISLCRGLSANLKSTEDVISDRNLKKESEAITIAPVVKLATASSLESVLGRADDIRGRCLELFEALQKVSEDISNTRAQVVVVKKHVEHLLEGFQTHYLSICQKLDGLQLARGNAVNRPSKDISRSISSASKTHDKREKNDDTSLDQLTAELLEKPEHLKALGLDMYEKCNQEDTVNPGLNIILVDYFLFSATYKLVANNVEFFPVIDKDLETKWSNIIDPLENRLIRFADEIGKNIAQKNDLSGYDIDDLQYFVVAVALLKQYNPSGEEKFAMEQIYQKAVEIIDRKEQPGEVSLISPALFLRNNFPDYLLEA